MRPQAICARSRRPAPAAATRRTLNATSAGALALLGGILGTAAAYLALIAWHWHDISYLNQPPYANLAVLILGLPVLAAAGSLAARPHPEEPRPPPARINKNGEPSWARHSLRCRRGGGGI